MKLRQGGRDLVCGHTGELLCDRARGLLRGHTRNPLVADGSHWLRRLEVVATTGTPLTHNVAQHDFPMVALWIGFRFPMVPLSFPYGIAIVAQWVRCVFPAIFLWFAAMVSLWFPMLSLALS